MAGTAVESGRQGLPDDFMFGGSAPNKTRVEFWPARQWGKLTVRPGTQPDFPEMQSFTRSEWRPRKSARRLEREADARINLSAALEIAAEDVFGIEPKIGIAAQRQVGANTGVIPSFFVGV